MKSKSFNLKICAIFIVLALALGIAAIPAVTASANSAQKDWYGSSTSGMLVTDENCPVVVESETLTFDINTFPANYYYNDEEFADYDARVTAHYNFYNPADYDVTMLLAFPFGEYPSYLGDHIDESGKYLVTAGGEKIESSIRHTFSYEGFDAERDVAKIKDGYTEHEFFSPDMPVHYYKLKISVGDGSYGFYLKSEYDEAKTAIFYSTLYDASEYYGIPNASIFQYEGEGSPMGTVKDGSVVNLFVVGDDFEDGLKYSIGVSWSLFEDELGSAEVTEKEITFKDVMLAYRDENSSVSELDWYNAAIEYFEHFGYMHYSISNGFMRWFEYKLVVPAGGRVENEVTAPLYPDIIGYYSPDVYGYHYLLSPAKCWASFGSLDIVINTPYYLTYSPLWDFEKVEGGYTLHFDKLPDGELDFDLCEEENPDDYFHYCGVSTGAMYKVFSIIMVVAGSIMLGVQLIAAIPLTIVFAVTGQFSTKPHKK